MYYYTWKITKGSSGELLLYPSYQYRLTPAPCRDEGRNVTFLFLVLSSEGATARQAVRDTWGRDGRGRVVFVVMSQSEEEEEETRREQSHFGDVLVTDINMGHQFYQHKQVGFSRPYVEG